MKIYQIVIITVLFLNSVSSRSLSEDQPFEEDQLELEKFARELSNGRELHRAPYRPCIWKICSFRRWRVKKPIQEKEPSRFDNKDKLKAIEEFKKKLEWAMPISVSYLG